jgi:hypothetical protein
MEEKDTTQVVEGETSQTEEGKAQPTVEELQAEIDRKEEVIRQTKKELSEARKRGGSKADIDALKQEVADTKRWIAKGMDELAIRLSGEEATQPVRKSFTQQLEEEESNRPKPQIDPAAQRFFDYLAEEDLDFDSDLVQDAIKETKTPQEAIKAVKNKVKTMSKAEIEKLAEQKASEKITFAVEEALKKAGLTATGVNAPSGSGRSFTAQQIANMSMEEFRENKEAILEAQRQGRIK